MRDVYTVIYVSATIQFVVNFDAPNYGFYILMNQRELRTLRKTFIFKITILLT